MKNSEEIKKRSLEAFNKLFNHPDFKRLAVGIRAAFKDEAEVEIPSWVKFYKSKDTDGFTSEATDNYVFSTETELLLVVALMNNCKTLNVDDAVNLLRDINGLTGNTTSFYKRLFRGIR